MKLYHYTCAHSVPGIEKDRWLKGRAWPFLPEAGELVHLTDLDVPDRAALQLTSYTLNCDRTEYRVTCWTTEAIHWPKFARTIPVDVRRELEDEPGALPMHWYVCRMPVAVLRVDSVVSLRVGSVDTPP